MKKEYKIDLELTNLVRDIIEKLNLDYIDKDRIICVRSYGSKTKAVARIWGFPKIYQVALNMKPVYIIEVISENFDKLDYIEKLKTLIHEILHIPKNFGGGLLPHKKYVTEERVNQFLKEYLEKRKLL